MFTTKVYICAFLSLYFFFSYIYIYIYINKKINACWVLTSFWGCLKYNMIHCYLHLFVLFPFKLFLFQAESMIRRDGKWLMSAAEWKNEGGLSWVVYASFMSLCCYCPTGRLFPLILLNIENRAKGNICVPSEAFLRKLDRQLKHDI